MQVCYTIGKFKSSDIIGAIVHPKHTDVKDAFKQGSIIDNGFVELDMTRGALTVSSLTTDSSLDIEIIVRYIHETLGLNTQLFHTVTLPD